MKWLRGLLAAMLLASLMVVPSGCGGESTTELQPQTKEPQHAGGHAAASEGMGKKPPTVSK